MTRRRGRVQPCTRVEARRRQAHARQFLDVAELAAGEYAGDDSLEYTNAAVALAVLTGIAASDAACCSELGERCRGDDHAQAERVLARIEPHGRRAAKELRKLVNLKDDAQYGFYSVSNANVRGALRAAQALVEHTNDVLTR